jgi:signal peptidase I
MAEERSDYKKESYYGTGSFILELLKIFFLAFIIIIPVRAFLFQPFFVQGASMEPNFYDSEYLIIDEISYRNNYYKRNNNNL